MEVDFPKAHGHTIFCDDVREEVGNKQSYMGVYQGIMYVAAPFPATIARLSMAISYRELVGKCSGTVRVNVFLPGDADDAPTIDQEIPFAEMRDNFKMPPRDPDFPLDKAGLSMNFLVQFSPLTLKKRGFIRVRMKVGNETVRVGSLKVDNPPNFEDQSEKE